MVQSSLQLHKHIASRIDGGNYRCAIRLLSTPVTHVFMVKELQMTRGVP